MILSERVDERDLIVDDADDSSSSRNQELNMGILDQFFQTSDLALRLGRIGISI